MSKYEHGALYRAQVNGGEVQVVWNRSVREWFDIDGWTWMPKHGVTDVVGPLRVVEPGQVVLDIPFQHVDHIVRILRRNSGSVGGDIADQIEAQTKPPRIPEPGLWGVVDGYLTTQIGWGVPLTFVRHPGGWVTPQGELIEWARIGKPTLVREGIE